MRVSRLPTKIPLTAHPFTIILPMQEILVQRQMLTTILDQSTLEAVNLKLYGSL